jgi:hypothetical protein
MDFPELDFGVLDLMRLAIPLGHLAISIGVTVLLLTAWRLTAMRGWMILGISWGIGCLAALPSLYGQFMLRHWEPGEYGNFFLKISLVAAVTSAVTTVLTVAGFVVLLSECRRLLARRAA